MISWSFWGGIAKDFVGYWKVGSYGEEEKHLKEREREIKRGMEGGRGND